jgi:hypothetical protein
MRSFLFILFLLVGCFVSGQEPKPLVLSLDEAIAKLKADNLLLKNSNLELEAVTSRKLGWLPNEPLSLHYFYGSNNGIDNNYIFESKIPFGSIPAMLKYKKLHQQEIQTGEVLDRLQIQEAVMELKIVYYNWLFADKKKKVLEDFLGFFKQYSGENEEEDSLQIVDPIKEMERAMLLYGVDNEIKMLDTEIRRHRLHINRLLMDEEEWLPDYNTSEIFIIDFPQQKGEVFPGPGTVLDSYHEKLALEKEKEVMGRAELFPSLVLGAFSHKIYGNKGVQGIYAGLDVPLWDWISGDRKRTNQLNTKIAANKLAFYEFSFQREIEGLINELDGEHLRLQHHYSYVLPYAYALRENTIDRFFNRDIELDELFENLQKVKNLEVSYLETLIKYNVSAIELEFMIQ